MLKPDEKMRLIRLVSGEYLTESIPDALLLQESAMDIEYFCKEHVWEPFQQYTGNWIWNNIQETALRIEAFITTLSNE
jgi:hypothetical protein